MGFCFRSMAGRQRASQVYAMTRAYPTTRVTHASLRIHLIREKALRFRAFLTVTALFTASCATEAPDARPSTPKTTQQALAQLACPHRIAEVNAWVNHMPGVGRAARELNVDVRLVEATDTAVVLKSLASTGDTLILEIRTAPTAPIAGRVAYREPVPDPLYRRVSFICRGGEIFSLDQIEQVY